MSELTIARAGLLLIDVQREYFAERGPLRIPDGPLVLARLRQLVEAARAAHLPIIHVRHEEAPGAPVFDPDGPLVETMPDVAPQGLEPIVTKHAPGSFTGTELSDVLDQFDVRRLVIGGFMTHMCCDSTARQAVERGLEVVFLTDGTATRDLALGGRKIQADDVHAATLAAQADGFSTLADCAGVRGLLVEAAW
jgi:nicotinamidase-related amidase